jgi:outer membrane lipoprotein-sorting protein
MPIKRRLVRASVMCILAVMVLTGAVLAGWRLYQGHYENLSEEALLRRLEKNLQQIERYHTRFTTTVQYHDSQVYQVEIWRCSENGYRVEMITNEEGRQTGLHVMISDGSRAYYYDPEIEDFYEVHDLGLADLPHLALEEYWNSLLDSQELTIVSTEAGLRHRYFRVEIKPGQPHRHRAKELVWLEANSLLPVRIELFDENGLPTQVTVFEMIRINPELEPTLFLLADSRDDPEKDKEQ